MAKHVPYPPYDDRPINPYSKIGCGANYGICKPDGSSFVHSMVGYLASTDTYFRLPHVCSLTPWGIGGSADGALDGKIWRWMDYKAFDDVQPWSSGPANYPYFDDGPAFIALRGVAGVNGMAQAIETSDGGNINTPVSQKQWVSIIWLSAAIAHDYGVTSENYRAMVAFMHHREMTTPAYKDCPFPRIYNFTDQYIDGIVRLMEYFEGKRNSLDDLLLTVAGLSIDLRHVGRMRDNLPAPSPEPSPAPVVDWVAGKSIRAKKDVVVRKGWGTDSQPMFTVKAGEFMKIVDPKTQWANAIEWMDIVGIQGSGWAPKQDFELASPATAPTGPIFQDFTPNRTFTVGPGGATIRQWANRQSPIVVKHVKPGTKIVIDGYYFGESINGENRWLVQYRDPEEKEPRGRIHASAFIESL